MPLLITFFIIIAVFIAYLKTPKGKGMLGEFLIKMLIGKTKPSEKYIINNLMLKTENEKTSQIDHVVINPRGIFVIETKNYSGRIYGQENHQEWTQVLQYGKIKNKLYNPIKQNKTHIYHISKVLSEKLPITSAVVFVQANVQHINASGVYTPLGLKRLLKQGERALSFKQMELAYNELVAANQISVSNREHIKNIQTIQEEIKQNICPRCGKTLFRKKGKGTGLICLTPGCTEEK